jgi:hypothetical protein
MHTYRTSRLFSDLDTPVLDYAARPQRGPQVVPVSRHDTLWTGRQFASRFGRAYRLLRLPAAARRGRPAHHAAGAAPAAGNDTAARRAAT